MFHMDSAAHSGTGAQNRPIFQENWRSPLWLMCFETRWRPPTSEVICWRKGVHSCRRGPTTAMENQCPDTPSICFFCCRSLKKVYPTVPSSHDKVALLSTHFGLSLLRGGTHQYLRLSPSFPTGSPEPPAATYRGDEQPMMLNHPPICCT